MPNIKNIETVNLIAHNYCSNGHNKTKAMIDAGYDEGYADSGRGHKIVFGNIRIKAAISKIIAKNQAKIDYNYDVAITELNQVIANLKSKALSGDIQANQALTGAIREKNAITGLHKQTIKQELEAPQLSEKEREALSEPGQIYKLRIAQGG